jgi:hypothetical protein
MISWSHGLFFDNDGVHGECRRCEERRSQMDGWYALSWFLQDVRG